MNNIIFQLFFFGLVKKKKSYIVHEAWGGGESMGKNDIVQQITDNNSIILKIIISLFPQSVLIRGESWCPI